MDIRPEIPDFYAEKTILVTGCTGFIGKVLLWKLLRSCPKLDKIYILLRPKKGKTINERKKDLLESPIFKNFELENPGLLKKLKALRGDVAEENLGLSDADKQLLINDVSIVFYSVAILKMDVDLKKAINVNTKGVIRCLNIASEMKQLMAFIYVSTAYCYNEVSHVQEKLYKSHVNPHHIMQAIEGLPDAILDKVTMDIIAPLPNTYTFSKRLAESILIEYKTKVPLIVTRPTIVMPSVNEPIPGWVDSLNGPVGIAVAVGVGILHSIFICGENRGDLVPVDIVCNRLIAIPWAENKKNLMFATYARSSEIVVYNLALFEREQITWSEYESWCRNTILKYPFRNMLWYPCMTPIHFNFIKNKIITFIFQRVPAYTIDFLLKLLGKKPFLVRAQQKIMQGVALLTYFSTKDWIFETENTKQLNAMMNEADYNIFPIGEKEVDEQLVTDNACLVIRKYTFHEKFEDPAENRFRLKLFYALQVFVKMLVYYFIFKFLFNLVETVRDTWIQD